MEKEDKFKHMNNLTKYLSIRKEFQDKFKETAKKLCKKRKKERIEIIDEEYMFDLGRDKHLLYLCNDGTLEDNEEYFHSITKLNIDDLCFLLDDIEKVTK